MPYRDHHPQCPRCMQALEQLEKAILPMQGCASCHGAWLGQEQFERLCAALTSTRAVSLVPGDTAEPALTCPTCHRGMEKLSASSVVVDRCQEHGLWFDWTELQRTLSGNQ